MQIIELDISNKGVLPLLFAKQGDVGRKFRAVITDGGAAYEIPADAVLSVWYSGASGEGNYSMIGEDSAFAIEGNTVTVELITQMLNNHGGGNLSLVMNRQDGTQIGTWNIPYDVEKLPGMGSPAAEQYFTALSENAAKAAESAAKAAEAAATFKTDTTLSVAGKAADAAATGEALSGKAPLALGAPHNYLDNSDFRNPVNQRGQTSYSSAGYCIDRWFMSAWNTSAPTVTVEDGGIHLTGGSADTANTSELAQAIEAKGLCGKIVTVAVKYNIFVVSDQTIRHLNVFCDNVHMASAKVATSSNNLLLKTFTIPEETSLVEIKIGTSANHGGHGTFDAVLEWAALYEGEYTAETLPDYKPKGYGAELAECQRYFIRLIAPTSEAMPAFTGFGTVVNSTLFAVCALPVPMRILPTVTGASLELITKDIAHYKAVSSLDIYPNYATNAVIVEAISSETLTTGDVYYLVGRRSTSYLDLSADL